MYCSFARISGFILTLTFGCSLALGFTFSVDGGPAGSVPSLYTDGTLLTFTGPTTYSLTNTLSGLPIDAIHVGTPLKGVIVKSENSYHIVSPIFFSVDNAPAWAFWQWPWSVRVDRLFEIL